MNGIKVRIIQNLKNRVHPVNELVALSGINDTTEGFAALAALTEEGIVKTSTINIALPGQRPVTKNMYALSFSGSQTDFGLQLVK